MGIAFWPELVFAAVFSVVPIVLGYVVIRLGVRHGVLDAHRRMGSAGSGSATGSG